MKLKKLLSFAAAAVMAITSLTGAMTISASADDDESGSSAVILPDRGMWSQTSITNTTQLKIMNYPTDNKYISSLEGKNDIYVTFRVSGVTANVKAYLALWTKAGTTLSIWDSSDEKANTAGVTNPFVEITKDGTYTATLHSSTAFTADTTFDFLAVVFKSSVKNASLQSVTSEDPIKATYDVSENGDGSVTATVYSDGTFLVSGTGNTMNYGTDSTNPYLGPWCLVGHSQNIKSIVVEKGVTSIGTYLLASFTNATSASIPNTVTSIGQGAFSQNYALKEVKITDKTTTNKLTSLGKGAFQYCTSLEVLDEYILSGVTEIPESCFWDCQALKSVSLNDGITSIEYGAFHSCYSLDSITIPEGVTYIGDYAFKLCPLTSVKIPDSVTYIGDLAFNGSDTFLDDAPLANVEISDNSNLKTIGDHAFQNAVITSINLPEGLETIGEYAFYGCPLTSLDIPSTVTSIGRQAFRNCKLTGDIIIPEGVTALNANIFYSNTSEGLNIYVKGQITSIGNDPFGSCAGKIYVYDKNTYDFIAETGYGTAELILEIVASYDISENGDGSVTATLYPNGSLVISGTGAAIDYTASGDAPWYKDGNVSSITSIVVESGITSLGSYLFDGCENAASVSLPDTLTSIGANCFSSTGLTAAAIPDSVTEIGASAFSGSSSLSNVKLPKNLTSIESFTFKDCTSLASVSIPATVQTIGQGAFKECTTLKTITIPGGVTSIGTETFAECTGLETVTVQEGVTELSEHMFYGCNSLKDVYIYSTELTSVADSSNADTATFGFMNNGTYEIGNQIYHVYRGSTTEKTLKDAAYLTKENRAYFPVPLEPIVKVQKNGQEAKIATVTADDSIAGTAQIKLTFDCAPDVSFNEYATIEVNAVVSGTENYQNFSGNNWTTGGTNSVTLPLASAVNAGDSIDLSAFTYAWGNAEDYVYGITKVEFLDENGNVLYKITASSEALEELAEAIANAEAIDTTPYTEESVKALTDIIETAKELLIDEPTVAEINEAITDIENAVKALKPAVVAGTVTGTINVSDKDNGTEMTVIAVAADGTEVSVIATSMGTYVIENLPVGDYTLIISGGKYAERSYEITVEEGSIAQDVYLNPYGDINGDGKVTTADVGLANSHAKGVTTLTDYDFVCGDVNCDGGITTADVGMINSHAKGVKALW